jgi:hypothetical protein
MIAPARMRHAHMVGWNTPLWRRSTVTNEDFLRRGSYFSVTANMDKVIPVVCRHIVTDEMLYGDSNLYPPQGELGQHKFDQVQV